MCPSPRHTLSKDERLCGKRAITSLLKRGRYLSCGCFRICRAPSERPFSRILISVPKKSFKRAVKRNLLKRRIRESFRLQKELLGEHPQDLMFIYTERTVLPYADIYTAMGQALEEISKLSCAH